jgi:hypothetical protein
MPRMQHVPNKKNNNKFVSFFFFLFFSHRPFIFFFFFFFFPDYLFVCLFRFSLGIYAIVLERYGGYICVCVCARARERERPPRASKNMSPAVYNGKKKKENPKEAIGNIR